MSAAGRSGLLALLVMGGLSVRPGGASAQGLVRILVAPSVVQFPVPSMVDFEAGYIETGPLEVVIESRPPRRAWDLYLRAADPDLGIYGKPLADLLWRVEGSQIWQPLTGDDQPIGSGQGDRTLRLYFRIRLDWTTDEPGDYGVGLTFTGIRL